MKDRYFYPAVIVLAIGFVWVAASIIRTIIADPPCADLDEYMTCRSTDWLYTAKVAFQGLIFMGLVALIERAINRRRGPGDP